jgi:ribonuclease HI/exonuclease III
MKDSNTTHKKGKSNINIWQQNINKSRTCQHELISSGKLISKGIDIVALQEPAINFLNKTVASRDWKVIYPSTHACEPGKTRSIILVRDDLLTDGWEQLDFPSGDVTAIRIKSSWGKATVFNIYNDCKHNETLEQLTEYHRKHMEDILGTVETMGEHHLIWVGDFNRHHPYWDSPENSDMFTRKVIDQAEILIQVLAETGLEMALPAGTPTHEHSVTKRWSRLDHVFVTEHTLEAIDYCDAHPDEIGVNTDHFPIITKLNLHVATAPRTAIRNFRDVDWKEFREKLSEELAKKGVASFIKTQEALDQECTKLTSILQETIAAKVPEARLGPHAKRWWTKELTNLRKEMLRIRRKACKERHKETNPAWEQFKDARRKFGNELNKTKKNHWRDWLEKADDPDLWTAHKYISALPSDCGKTRIPDLTYTEAGEQKTVSTNEAKSKALAKAFFPRKPEGNTPARSTTIPAPACKADPISRDQIKRALSRLKPYKAPGPDGIPNIVLTKCADILEDRLWHIYSAIWDRGLYYEPWKKFTTVVLRKPGKPRYDVPKAYRPIALLNTLGKVLTSIVAEQLTFYTEKYSLLPPLHFGGRPARTTNDAIHYLVYKIKDAWRKKQVVSVLFLDIEGAFPNAVNQRLLHNLAQRKVPLKITRFVENMLKDRTTWLKFDDHVSESIEIDNGIGQGDPLSMVLYQYYNADLLDIPASAAEFAAAYVDDAILVATAKTFEDTHSMLENMMTREGGAIEWAKAHNSNFEMSKLALMDFAHRSKKMVNPPLYIANTLVEPVTNTKYLGVYLDNHLDWKAQEANAIKKGTKWAAQIKRVVRPEWGLTPKFARKMYTSVAIPRILYGVDIWAPPTRGDNERVQTQSTRRIANKISSVQRQGTLAVVGGLRTSPTDSLCVHANILPAHLELDKQCSRAAIRLATLPAVHPLTNIYRACAKRKVKRHKSPLHHLANTYKTDPKNFETIPTAGRNPALMGKRPFKTVIPRSKEASKEEDKRALEHVKIYTDGSAQDGEVGAAAVLTRNGKPVKTMHLHLGKASEHTVFEAELTGLILGLQMVKEYRKGNFTFAIGADNQAALRALSSKLNKPGHYLAAEVISMAAKLEKTKGKKYSLTFRWTAGHSGIPGNEKADEEAKTAAEGKTSNEASLPKALRKPLKISKSAAKQKLQEERKIRWAREWRKSPRYDKHKNLDPSLPSQKFMKLISSKKIPRSIASKMYQLRSGHVPLNAYLHRFKRKTGAQCPACGAPKETPQHFLLECPAYAYERWKIKPKKGRMELKFADLLANGERTTELAQYIQATKRFAQETQDQINGTQPENTD